jgi:hypothetical protein
MEPEGAADLVMALGDASHHCDQVQLEPNDQHSQEETLNYPWCTETKHVYMKLSKEASYPGKDLSIDPHNPEASST